MKFKLFGDLDCPDWVMANLNLLAKLSSVKVKLICNLVVTDVGKKEIDFDKLLKITSDAKFDESDSRACFMVASFILKSAWRFNVDHSIVVAELQQLGLPKEHTTAIAKVYSEKADDMRNALKSQSLRLNRLEDVETEVINGLRTESFKVNTKLGLVKLKLDRSGSKEIVEFCVTKEKLAILIQSLKEAEALE
ncbi:COMM domain-containing protein 4 [Tetranychus urticae]|uniref:COMM domain-containing protein n=1 Tax=Tetranychus urticae TaxID=32264 RepID=T1JWJ0_TETUR|nr:COMM domain-containing protein 4 [Tetranychus urticae]